MFRVTFVLILLAVSIAIGQERLVLDTPVFVSPGATTFRVARLALRRATAGPESTAQIHVVLQETNAEGVFVVSGKTLDCVYQGATAETLIAQLNRADLSNNSLERRIITRCQTDGKLNPGNVSGTPQ
jgi:hypothetical protein